MCTKVNIIYIKNNKALARAFFVWHVWAVHQSRFRVSWVCHLPILINFWVFRFRQTVPPHPLRWASCHKRLKKGERDRRRRRHFGVAALETIQYYPIINCSFTFYCYSPTSIFYQFQNILQSLSKSFIAENIQVPVYVLLNQMPKDQQK